MSSTRGKIHRILLLHVSTLRCSSPTFLACWLKTGTFPCATERRWTAINLVSFPSLHLPVGLRALFGCVYPPNIQNSVLWVSRLQPSSNPTASPAAISCSQIRSAIRKRFENNISIRCASFHYHHHHRLRHWPLLVTDGSTKAEKNRRILTPSPENALLFCYRLW